MKISSRLLVSVCALTLTGCVPLTYKCAEGKYSGLQKRFVNPAPETNITLHVVMIHGMRTHVPGYGETLAHNLANRLKMTVVQTNAAVPLLSAEGHTNWLRELEFAREWTKMHVYELTWSPVTSPRKDATFKHDNAFQSRRICLNRTLKKDILDDGFGDATLYLNREFQAQMQEPIVQTFRAVLKDLQPQDSIAIVCSSLGSKMTFDTFEHQAADLEMERFAGHTTDIIMLANQIPLLALGDKETVALRTNSIVVPSMKTFFEKAQRHRQRRLQQQGTELQTRVFDPGAGTNQTHPIFTINVVAATDPNDLLSYPLVRANLPEVPPTNSVELDINLVNIFSHNAWAVPFVLERPDYAHSHYDQNKWLIKKLVDGFSGRESCIPEAPAPEKPPSRASQQMQRHF